MPLKKKFTKQVVDLINKQIKAVRTVTSQGLFLRQFTSPSGGGIGEENTDEKVKVTVDDILAEHLNDKLVGAAGIVTVILNPGEQEDLEISFAVENGTSFPVSPRDWQFFYRTDLDTLYLYDTISWVAISGSGVWANVNLSNLVAPTAINQDLLPGIDSTIDLGNSTTPLRFANAFFGGLLNIDNIVDNAAQYADINYTGTLGLPVTGIAGRLTFSGIFPGSWTIQSVAAINACLTLNAAIDSTLNCINAASRYSFLHVNEAGGTVNYNTLTNQAFHYIHYWKKDDGEWVPKDDVLWSGVRRDNYCGIGNISSGTPGVNPDVWTTGAFVDGLPDTNFASAATARMVAVMTSDSAFPIIYVYAVCSHSLVISPNSVSGNVHYIVTDAATELGIDALGSPTCVFSNYNALVALCSVVPPFDTIEGAELDKMQWILRRHYV